MKIGMVHYSVSPIIGGVEIVIRNQLRVLAENHEVHLIYGFGGGHGGKNVIEHEIPLLFPKAPEIQEIQKDLLQYGANRNFMKVKNKIKRELIKILSELDSCIVHNLPSMPFNFAATAAVNEAVSETGVRTIYWIHDIVLVRSGWKDREIKSFPLTLLHYKDKNIRYVTVSRSRADELSGLPEPFAIPNVAVIPNGVPLEEFSKDHGIEKSLRKKLKVLSNRFMILTPARMTQRKNIEFVLQVVYELKKIMKRKIRLIITGPPDYYSEAGMRYFSFLERSVKELGIERNVMFCHKEIGPLSDEEMINAFKIANVVLLASREEGFGLPVIEATAARKPVFCSRIPSFEELAKKGFPVNLFSLESGPKNVALKIGSLLKGGFRIEISEDFIRRYDWRKIIEVELMPLMENV